MVLYDLCILVRQMRVYAERRLKHLDLGFPEITVLLFLSAHESMNQEQVAKHLAIDKGAIAKTMSKLEEKGLITRSENKENKREKIITATEQSAPYLEEIKEVMKEWSSHVHRGIPEDEREKLIGYTMDMVERSSLLLLGMEE